MEAAVKDLEKEEADMIHFKISLAHQISKPPNEDLSKDENKALKELQSDTSISILDLLLSSTVRTIWKNVWII